jgi:hypothetical protein
LFRLTGKLDVTVSWSLGKFAFLICSLSCAPVIPHNNQDCPARENASAGTVKLGFIG